MTPLVRVAHVTTACRGAAPGIDAAVTAIAAATALITETPVMVLGILPQQAAWPAGNGLERRRIAIVGPQILAYAPDLEPSLSRLRPQVVHQHGAWQYPGLAASRWCRRHGTPAVFSPHGMFSIAGMASHRVRKWAAWLGWQRKVATTSHLLHATSDEELLAIRRLGLRNPVAVIPLGVTVPAECPLKREEPGLRAVYLGRIDPLKGVDDLVMAWAAVRPRGWSLTIAGPDHLGHMAGLRRSIKTHGLDDVVSVRGPVWDHDRDSLLDAADLLVLPSYTENFGLVVAEALARAVPVITTVGTPWRCLEEDDCGWVAACGVPGLTAALDAACRTDRPTLRLMGRRGWNMVRKRFSLMKVGERFAATYAWLCDVGEQPPYIDLAAER